MRDYKFRGKMIDNGEWVYGYYFEGFTGISYILVLHDHILGMTEFYEVIPETVGQFTGLHDKNGKEIYEGDICDDARGFRFVVIWEDNARFLGRGIGKQKEYIWYVGQEPAVEIIGNIYENTEPLEAAND